jgi:hypothetical protein
MSFDIQEPAHAQPQAGSDLVAAAVVAAGASSIPPDPTHWGFLLGLEAYRLGQPECPFPAGCMAAAQFQHGWADAEVDAARADQLWELHTLRNYCGE